MNIVNTQISDKRHSNHQEEDDHEELFEYNNEGLSTGAIIGIVIACLFVLYIVYRIYSYYNSDEYLAKWFDQELQNMGSKVIEDLTKQQEANWRNTRSKRQESMRSEEYPYAYPPNWRR
jgi:hypothetical protein